MGGGQPGRCAWAQQTARHGIHTLRRGHGDDLLSRPNLEGESAGSPAEDGIGAVVERVEGGTMLPRRTQTRRALWRSAGSSLSSWWLELFLGKENAGASKDYLEKV